MKIKIKYKHDSILGRYFKFVDGDISTAVWKYTKIEGHFIYYRYTVSHEKIHPSAIEYIADLEEDLKYISEGVYEEVIYEDKN